MEKNKQMAMPADKAQQKAEQMNKEAAGQNQSQNSQQNPQMKNGSPGQQKPDGAGGNPQMKKGGPGQGGGKPQQKKGMQKSHWFMIAMIAIYAVLYFVSPDKTVAAVEYVLNIFKEIIPILAMVYVFMFIFSLIDEKKMRKYIGSAPMGLKYILLTALGTLSHGPIYAWYPLLKDLNSKGLTYGPISSFLYARGIKLTLIPMLISFFDLKYAVILTVVTLVFSVIEGIIIEATYPKAQKTE